MTSRGTGRSSPGSVFAGSDLYEERPGRSSICFRRRRRRLSVANVRVHPEAARRMATGNRLRLRFHATRGAVPMTGPISASAPIGESGKSLTFETGRLAPQADGAVVVSVGDTKVLVTAQASRSIREGIDFFPLTVDVEERMYAAGKIPGSFFRREGRPDRAGDPGLPAHRPAVAPVLPEGLPQRDADRRHRHRSRPGEPPRRAGHQRGVGGADALRHPVRRPDRRGPPRPPRRHLDPAPDLPGG